MRCLTDIIRCDRLKILAQGGVDELFDAICATGKKHGYELRVVDVAMTGPVIASEVTFRRFDFAGTKKCSCVCCHAEEQVVIPRYNFEAFARASREEWRKVGRVVTYCSSRSYC